MLFLLFSIQVLSAQVQFSVVGPCESKPIAEQNFEVSEPMSVGDFTVNSLKELDLKFTGSRSKIDSINGTPVGQAAFEILSRSHMRAYGWCYFVDGRQPLVFPDEAFLLPETNEVRWVFSYAEYKDGDWLSMCEPSWKIKSDFMCSDESQ